MATIFVRERRKIIQGEKKPRFRVVGVTGADLKLYSKHIRRQELNVIAEKIGAEVVYLPNGGDGAMGDKAD